MNFFELSESLKEEWQRTTGGDRLFGLSFDDDAADPVSVRDQVSDFLEKYGFKNLEYIDRGSSAVILKDLDHPDLVFRLAPTYSLDTRAVIPQVLQPIHVQLFNEGRLKLEFLPNISIPESMDDDTFEKLFDAFLEEVRKSGHHCTSDSPQFDIGLIEYEDVSNPGTCRQAFIAADASLIPPVSGAVPSCSENYPSLEDQWRVQCRIVEKDPRLQTLLSGLPTPLPETKRYPINTL